MSEDSPYRSPKQVDYEPRHRSEPGYSVGVYWAMVASIVAIVIAIVVAVLFAVLIYFFVPTP